VAVAQIQPDGKGGWQEQDVSFFRVTAWRALRNMLLAPDQGTRVVGRLKTNTWQSPEGELRIVFEIVAEDVAPSLRVWGDNVRKARSRHARGC
jgi:single-stranded DNA-binding protein